MSVAEFEDQISLAMQRDQFRLRRSLRKLKQQKNKSSEKDWQNFRKKLTDSIRLKTTRTENCPQLTIDQSLPIFDRREEIIHAIQQHQVVVLSGETGSGKSTQIPLMALQAGYGVNAMIGHTQPRRIAARGVASRIAQQMGTPIGQQVGFKIRFADKTDEKTYIKLMTDGILLAETQTDRFLDQYDLLIVDEAHERSLNIDFLLGYLKRILSKRPSLRLVITSATIDTERFAEHFTLDPENPVPVIAVEGRTYPVEIRYLEEESKQEVSQQVVNACQELSLVDDGDMLVFLPTEGDIRNTAKKLRSAHFRGRTTEVVPLYARLSTEQQNQVFQPGKNRRIVLATNVAESSITVPRIRFVIDTGTARISYYAARSKVQRLPIQAVSQASADQRAGRCGRIGPGICMRLYTEEDYQSRPAFTTPEIRRTNLASVILQTLALKLGRIDEFPFIDPPHSEAIRDGFKTLFEIGAIDDRRQLTPMGRKLARMPVDPRIGRMIFAADEENCLAEILIIAAALEIQDPRVRPVEHRAAADKQHEKFLDEKSDFMSLLKLWDFFHARKQELSRSKLRAACQTNFLSYPLMQQWLDIHRQLKGMAYDQQLKSHNRKDDYNAIHRSLLRGLLSGVAMRGDRHEFTGASNIKFFLWPGSGVFESKPKWIIAGEVVETARRYGRTIGKISPEWIESIADHLVKKRYADPRWSKKRQAVIADEHVTLFGLPIVSGRSKVYSRIEPEICRDIFIDKALTEGELEGHFDFFDHNLWLLDQVQNEAAKTRDREMVIDQLTVAAFYHDKLPSECVDTAALKRSLRKNPDLDQRLRMTRSDLLPSYHADQLEGLFPDQVQIGSMQIPVAYRFAPGAKDDGATVKLPLEGLGQIDEVQTGWLIPGLMKSRIVGLIRSLPKGVRRNLVPAPDTAEQVAEIIPFGQGLFLEAVARELTRIGGLPIDVTQFKPEKLDQNLNLNIQVTDDTGEVIAEGRSLATIRDQLGSEHSTNIVETEDDQWKVDGLRDWTWEDLPAEVKISRGAMQLAAYPAIVDQSDSVGIRLCDSAQSADYISRQGLVRLFQIVHKKNLKSQVNWLPDLEMHSVQLSRLIGSKEIRSQLSELIARIAFVDRKPVPRTRQEFDRIQQNSAEKISMATQEVARWFPKFGNAVHACYLNLESLASRHGSVKGDVKAQITNLKQESFLARTPWQWLSQFPRYFDAIHFRLDRITDKDKQHRDLIANYWDTYQQLKQQHEAQAIVDPELITFRWMIEELRVSLFAQKLGTCIKVSPQRMEKQLGKIRKV